jgi:hypothetical protein
MSEPEDVVVGIDVAKASLDIAIRPSGQERHVANDPDGIAEAVVWLQALGPQVIVVEATGGYEVPLVAELGVAPFRSLSSIPARCATSPAPPGGWPRPIGWTRTCWPTSRRQ